MKKIMQYLGDASTPVALATTGDGRPHVRFFSFKMTDSNGNIYLLTSKKKNVYTELKNDNHIEICSLPTPGMEWIRVKAEIEFITDPALTAKAFTILPLLEKAYSTPQNPDIILLKLTNIQATLYNLSGETTTL